MTSTDLDQRQPRGLAIVLILTGIVGWLSSLELSVAKFQVLQNPDAELNCDFSVLVQCGKNLDSWQGSVFFGIPNPLFGLGAFMAPIVVGVAILAGARFAHWFWLSFWGGVVLGMVWVVWFIYQSIFALGTLCPWCMTMWASMIPLFWVVTLHVVRSGVLPVPQEARDFFAEAYRWTWVIVILSYVAIVIVAQLRLDLLYFIAPR